MPEVAEKELSFRDYVALVKRRGSLFFWIGAPLLTVGIALAFGLPPIYESSAILLAEQQEVPEYLVRSTVPDAPDQRIRSITQRVLTDENLGYIVEKYDLYPELRQEGGGNPVNELKRHFTLGSVDPLVLQSLVGNSDNAIAFTLTFEHPSAMLARDVAWDLVYLYLNENRLAREEMATGTMQFLTQEARRLEVEIAAKETELAEFKSRHSASLPELSNMNLQLMDRTERDVEDAEREIRTLRERQSLLESELAQLSPYAVVYDDQGNAILSPQDRLKMLQRSYVQLSAVYSQDHPDVLKTRREIEALSRQTGLPGIDRATLERELATRMDELAVARERYSATHPDVVRLERTVANLEAALAGALVVGPAGPARVAPPDNPLYIQKQVQLEGTKVDLAAALQRRTELRSKLTDLERRLLRTPEVEREYASLSRGYQQLLEQFGQVEAKQREAEIALNLESGSKGERFTVLDNPDLPSLPARPNRIAILFLTVVLAFAAAAGGIAIAEMSDRTVRNTRDVSSLLEIPPLVVIPYINNESDVRSKRWRRLMLATTVCVWIGVTAFFIVGPIG